MCFPQELASLTAKNIPRSRMRIPLLMSAFGTPVSVYNAAVKLCAPVALIPWQKHSSTGQVAVWTECNRSIAPAAGTRRNCLRCGRQRMPELSVACILILIVRRAAVPCPITRGFRSTLKFLGHGCTRLAARFLSTSSRWGEIAGFNTSPMS